MSNNIIQGPQYKSPIPQKTLGQLYFELCDKYADRICQIDGTTGEQETYSSVKQRSVRVAIELQKRGITSNDVIALCSGNTIDTIIPMLSTYYLGARVANLEPSLSVRQVEHLLSLVEPKIIFVEDKAFDLIIEALNVISLKAEVIKYSDLSKLTTPKENEESFKPVSVDLDETALFLFTSGTTGLPKAICHTNKSFVHAGCGTRDSGWGDAVFHVSRFYWITSHVMLISSFMVGGYRVFCQTADIETMLKAFETYKVQMALISTSLLAEITNFKEAKNYDLSSLKSLSVAGNPVNETLLQRIVDIFKNTSVLLSFGMSEGAFIAFDPATDQHFISTKINSCGKPSCGLSVKIADTETDEALGPNQKGELRVKGPMLFKGYYKMDSSDIRDKDGFVKTGDIAYYDEDRCLYVIERIKEMFKFRGWHIVPSFLEGILQEHSAVQEAAVFGIPLGSDGEAPTACVVVKNGFAVSKQELEEFVATKVPEKERLIGGITFVDSLPKTPTGKLLRREIKEKFTKNI